MLCGEQGREIDWRCYTVTYYHQIYRCRKCGNEFCPVTVHTETVMCIDLNNFLNRVNGELEWDHQEMPLAPRLYRTHTCPNGDIGVGDFIGYQKEEQ